MKQKKKKAGPDRTHRSQPRTLCEALGLPTKVLNDAEVKIDLIFCDVNMPEMDGLTMCREVHSDPQLRTIPIFMLTTQTSTQMKAEGKASGVIAWVVKPYEKNKVLGGVAKVLARSTVCP